MKTCTVCNTTKTFDEFYKSARAAGGRKAECRACTRESARKRRAANPAAVRAINRKSARKRREENPEAVRAAHRRGRLTARGRAGRLTTHARSRATAQGIPFALSVDDILARIERGICESTGLPLMLGPAGELGCKHPLAPSLDQIEAAKGYTPDNVRVVCAFWNFAKLEYPEWMVVDLMATAVANMYTAPAGLKPKVRPLTYEENQP